MGSVVNPNNYPAKENVFTILVVALTWAVFGIYIPEESLFLLFELFILVLIGISLYYKNPLDVIILGVIGVIFFVAFTLVDETPRFILMRTAALSAFFLLGFVLMIGPLSRISAPFLRLYKYRRHIGVTVFILGVIHLTQAVNYHGLDPADLLAEGDFVALGILTLGGLFFLAVTSWDYAQKKFHPLFFDVVHLLWIGVVFYVIWMDIQEYGGWGEMEPAGKKWLYPILVLFPLVTFRFSFARIALKSVMPWKQLHMLSWVVFLTLALHALTAYDSLDGGDELVKPVWIYVFIVFSIHGGVWIQQKLLGRKEICSENKQINGKLFYKTANVSEFQEKKGKRFILNKVPIAVFKVSGKFHAYSNVCAHQKGPIYKAAVDGEFIVCPWHNFQYNVKDGKGPVGFNDFIPYYQTLEKDEFVWVSLMN